jgi:molybdopterin-dependent oxidoreductase alpha subunit
VNETYYAAQKAARRLGTNHIDNSARVCHAPSTVALKESLGLAATTVSYRDLLETDLIVFIGSDAANNQPVLMKYVHLARKNGTRCVLVNPFKEPGLQRYWVPSSLDSALFGTTICDAFFPIRVGGDIAFLNGVLKHLVARGQVDHAFLDARTTGWDTLLRTLDGESLEELERLCGLPRQKMAEFADLYARARSAVFVWSMGVTMHRHGVDNVHAIVNLALARGMVGREGAGLMPIRGHSGVQGGAEMGCVPDQFPGGVPVSEESAAHLGRHWGFTPPGWKGHYVPEMIDAAARGELDVLYNVGSNLLGVLPDPDRTALALSRIPLRVHHDIMLNPQMFVPPGEAVLLLPATTRYEMAGGNTETTTERRVIYNPEIPGPRVAEARDEWRVLLELAARVRPEPAGAVHFADTAAIRAEIARVVPVYDGIQHLAGKGDQFQWGGARLAEGGRFPTLDGRARVIPVSPPRREIPQGKFLLTSRRGKQFNSMVFAAHDAHVGNGRDAVLLSPRDMERLRLQEGAPVLVRSETGSVRGRARQGDLPPGTVMMYWPEANVLVSREAVDPRSGIPAYRDAVVEVLAERGA